VIDTNAPEGTTETAVAGRRQTTDHAAGDPCPRCKQRQLFPLHDAQHRGIPWCPDCGWCAAHGRDGASTLA
jgi:hypothetical protein